MSDNDFANLLHPFFRQKVQFLRQRRVGVLSRDSHTSGQKDPRVIGAAKLAESGQNGQILVLPFVPLHETLETGAHQGETYAITWANWEEAKEKGERERGERPSLWSKTATATRSATNLEDALTF